MSSKFASILAQIDGVTDTFVLPEAFASGSVILAYNGQVYDRGQNIIAEVPSGISPSVQLSFIPSTDTHTLMLIYTPASSPFGGVRGQTFPPGGPLNDC